MKRRTLFDRKDSASLEYLSGKVLALVLASKDSGITKFAYRCIIFPNFPSVDSDYISGYNAPLQSSKLEPVFLVIGNNEFVDLYQVKHPNFLKWPGKVQDDMADLVKFGIRLHSEDSAEPIDRNR